MLVRREPVHRCQRLVHPDVAEARIHERQSDRRCREDCIDDSERLLCLPPRAFGLTEEASVVDRDRSAARKVLGGREIGILVPPTAFGGDERDCAERPVAGDERHAHRRLQAELFEDVVELRRFSRRLAQQLVGNLLEQLGLSCPDDVRDAVRRMRVRRILLGKLVGPAHFLGIGMSDRETLDRSILSDHVDRAPVGKAWDGEGREVRERSFVVERRCEELARFGDEPMVLGETTLRLVEVGGPDSRRCDVRQERRRAFLGFGELARVAIVEDERSEDALAVAERECHHRARALPGVGGAVLLRQPFGPLDVFRDDRRLERDGVRVTPDRPHRRRDVLFRQPGVRADAPDPAAFVVLPDGVRVGRERPAGERKHLRKHLFDVERAEEPG